MGAGEMIGGVLLLLLVVGSYGDSSLICASGTDVGLDFTTVDLRSGDLKSVCRSPHKGSRNMFSTLVKLNNGVGVLTTTEKGDCRLVTCDGGEKATEITVTGLPGFISVATTTYDETNMYVATTTTSEHGIRESKLFHIDTKVVGKGGEASHVADLPGGAPAQAIFFVNESNIAIVQLKGNSAQEVVVVDLELNVVVVHNATWIGAGQQFVGSQQDKALFFTLLTPLTNFKRHLFRQPYDLTKEATDLGQLDSTVAINGVAAMPTDGSVYTGYIGIRPSYFETYSAQSGKFISRVKIDQNSTLKCNSAVYL